MLPKYSSVNISVRFLDGIYYHFEYNKISGVPFLRQVQFLDYYIDASDGDIMRKWKELDSNLDGDKFTFDANNRAVFIPNKKFYKDMCDKFKSLTGELS